VLKVTKKSPTNILTE